MVTGRKHLRVFRASRRISHQKDFCKKFACKTKDDGIARGLSQCYNESILPFGRQISVLAIPPYWKLRKARDIVQQTKALPACPVETTLMLIGDKWKVLILRDLMPGTKRFGELKKSVGNVSQKVLTAQLRDMEEKGLDTRSRVRRGPAPGGVQPDGAGKEPEANSGRNVGLGRRLSSTKQLRRRGACSAAPGRRISAAVIYKGRKSCYTVIMYEKAGPWGRREERQGFCKECFL